MHIHNAACIKTLSNCSSQRLSIVPPLFLRYDFFYASVMFRACASPSSVMSLWRISLRGSFNERRTEQRRKVTLHMIAEGNAGGAPCEATDHRHTRRWCITRHSLLEIVVSVWQRLVQYRRRRSNWRCCTFWCSNCRRDFCLLHLRFILLRLLPWRKHRVRISWFPRNPSQLDKIRWRHC